MINEAIRERLRAEIQRQGREMKELSIAAGLGDSYVRDVLVRGRGKYENLIKVAAELGKPPEWILPPLANEAETELRATAIKYLQNRPSRAPRPPTNTIGREPEPQYGPPLPVLGAGRAGDDGTLLYSEEPLEWIPRPPSLEGVENAYATYVTGTSMFPRFKEREKVWVHPLRQPVKGDDVVVQLHPEAEGDAPPGYIKEFRRYTKSTLVLFQWNPEGEFEIDRDDVKSVHVIVGSMYF